MQNSTDDPSLTELASAALGEQLRIHQVDVERFELNAKLEPLEDGGLQIQILCSGREDHLLKAQVQVKGRGNKNGVSGKLLRTIMAQAARDLAVDCR